MQLERLPVAALGPHLVEVLAANRRHARVQPDVRCNRGMVAKRRHVLLNEIVAGRQRVIGGCLPALGFQQLAGHAIRGVAPRREHGDVTPLANRGAHVRAGLEDDEGLVPCGKVRRRREADGATTDDGNRE